MGTQSRAAVLQQKPVEVRAKSADSFRLNLDSSNDNDCVEYEEDEDTEIDVRVKMEDDEDDEDEEMGDGTFGVEFYPHASSLLVSLSSRLMCSVEFAQLGSSTTCAYH